MRKNSCNHPHRLSRHHKHDIWDKGEFFNLMPATKETKEEKIYDKGNMIDCK